MPRMDFWEESWRSSSDVCFLISSSLMVQTPEGLSLIKPQDISPVGRVEVGGAVVSEEGVEEMRTQPLLEKFHSVPVRAEYSFMVDQAVSQRVSEVDHHQKSSCICIRVNLIYISREGVGEGTHSEQLEFSAGSPIDGEFHQEQVDFTEYQS